MPAEHTTTTAPQARASDPRGGAVEYGPIFDLANDAIFVHDADTGEILDANRSAEQLYETTREALRTSSIEDYSAGGPPYTQRDALERLRAAAAGAAQVFEWHARARSGRLFWVEVNLTRAKIGGRDRLIAVVRDITDRKRMEESLRESEGRLRSLAESIPQMVWTTGPNGEADYLSPRWRAYTGFAPGDRPEAAWDALHPDDRPGAYDLWLRSTSTGAPYEVEYRLRRADGAYRWQLARAVPQRDASGRIIRWVGTTTDIHDLKELQAALRESDRRKSEFLAMLSHELRNPLAPIRNGLYILDRASCGTEQATRAKAVIRRQVDQLSRLVDDLLDVTRIARGKIQLQRTVIDAREVVRRTAEDHRAAFASRRVQLRIDEPADPVWIDADATRIAQVVGNLLHNAAKFTREGGTTTVRVSAGEGQAAVTVRDDGIGMDPAQVERMFEPFAQADRGLARTQGGLGLGLALVKGLVELHGGAVRASSAGPDCGAEFVVMLPRAAAPAAPSPARERSPGGGGRLVLIVEDNVDAGTSLVEVLELGGHRAHLATDGRSGIARARELRPDVVLCDIGLPDIDGLAVARTLRADPGLRGIRLVALSGYAQPEDRERAREAGFDAHLAKPPVLEQLAALVTGEAPDARPPSGELPGGRTDVPVPAVGPPPVRPPVC